MIVTIEFRGEEVDHDGQRLKVGRGKTADGIKCSVEAHSITFDVAATSEAVLPVVEQINREFGSIHRIQLRCDL